MEGWGTVFRAQGMAEAEVVKGFLESEDIPVALDYESAGKVYGITMDGLGEVRVRVPTEYVDVALLLIGGRVSATAESKPPLYFTGSRGPRALSATVIAVAFTISTSSDCGCRS